MHCKHSVIPYRQSKTMKHSRKSWSISNKLLHIKLCGKNSNVYLDIYLFNTWTFIGVKMATSLVTN